VWNISLATASSWNDLKMQAVSFYLKVRVTLISRNVLRKLPTPKSAVFSGHIFVDPKVDIYGSFLESSY